jgi:adenylate cyclase 8
MYPRFKTQKENERQEKLLLSVLPSFVAQQMIRDIALEEEKAQEQRHLSLTLTKKLDFGKVHDKLL